MVECRLCGRQIATPTDYLLVRAAVEQITAENADAIKYPAYTGVTFIIDASDAPE